jgi:hypothetical protein
MKPVDKGLAAILVACVAIFATQSGGIVDVGGGSIIAGKGLRALVKIETAPQQLLPLEQQLVIKELQQGDFDEWLDENCAKLKDGTTAHRVWDKDVDISAQAKFWQDAWAKMQPEPSIAVSNGRKGFSGPLPKTRKEVQALFDKYKG